MKRFAVTARGAGTASWSRTCRSSAARPVGGRSGTSVTSPATRTSERSEGGETLLSQCCSRKASRCWRTRRAAARDLGRQFPRCRRRQPRAAVTRMVSVSLPVGRQLARMTVIADHDLETGACGSRLRAQAADSSSIPSGLPGRARITAGAEARPPGPSEARCWRRRRKPSRASRRTGTKPPSSSSSGGATTRTEGLPAASNNSTSSRANVGRIDLPSLRKPWSGRPRRERFGDPALGRCLSSWHLGVEARQAAAAQLGLAVRSGASRRTLAPAAPRLSRASERSAAPRGVVIVGRRRRGRAPGERELVAHASTQPARQRLNSMCTTLTDRRWSEFAVSDVSASCSQPAREVERVRRDGGRGSSTGSPGLQLRSSARPRRGGGQVVRRAALLPAAPGQQTSCGVVVDAEPLAVRAGRSTRSPAPGGRAPARRATRSGRVAGGGVPQTLNGRLSRRPATSASTCPLRRTQNAHRPPGAGRTVLVGHGELFAALRRALERRVSAGRRAKTSCSRPVDREPRSRRSGPG